MVIREYRDGDAAGIVQISRDNARFYVALAPDHFRTPDEAGFVELFENDGPWRDAPNNLALVAEMDGEVAGYLEASIQPPLETARWQAQRDLGETRLAINFVGTGDAYKRQGVGTALVEAAETWGRSKGAAVAICDTYIDSPVSVPFWEERMGYSRRAIIFRKALEVRPSGPTAIVVLSGNEITSSHSTSDSRRRGSAEPRLRRRTTKERL